MAAIGYHGVVHSAVDCDMTPVGAAQVHSKNIVPPYVGLAPTSRNAPPIKGNPPARSPVTDNEDGRSYPPPLLPTFSDRT